VSVVYALDVAGHESDVYVRAADNDIYILLAA